MAPALQRLGRGQLRPARCRFRMHQRPPAIGAVSLSKPERFRRSRHFQSERSEGPALRAGLLLGSSAGVGRLGASCQLRSGQLRCAVCGNMQAFGDWHAAMDAQAKASGAKGFTYISGRPWCLRCGSCELIDPLTNRQQNLPARGPSDEALAKEKAARIIDIMRSSGFPWGFQRTHPLMEELRKIGEELDERDLMWLAAYNAEDMAHRQGSPISLR
jgi:hypothetical protein